MKMHLLIRNANHELDNTDASVPSLHGVRGVSHIRRSIPDPIRLLKYKLPRNKKKLLPNLATVAHTQKRSPLSRSCSTNSIRRIPQVSERENRPFELAPHITRIPAHLLPKKSKSYGWGNSVVEEGEERERERKYFSAFFLCFFFLSPVTSDDSCSGSPDIFFLSRLINDAAALYLSLSPPPCLTRNIVTWKMISLSRPDRNKRQKSRWEIPIKDYQTKQHLHVIFPLSSGNGFFLFYDSL